MKTIRFVDLFAGMGGIRKSFEETFNSLGYKTECILTSEIKPSAVKVLKANFEHKNLVGDIREIDAKELEDFDFLLGGFPCQSFSTAGKGLGFADVRGTMFFEVARILKEKRPYGFILENVEGLIKHDLINKSDKIGNTFSTMLKILEELGYKVSWKLLDSQFFGVPQSRKRVYIVGTLDKQIDLNSFDEKRVLFKDIMEHNQKTVNTEFTRALFNHFKPEELYGKSIKDKRGGSNNIHSWELELKGTVSDKERNLLNLMLLERRKKCWAEETGIKWMDGMTLTKSQIRTFCKDEDLDEMLDDLVLKKYLIMEYPKKQIVSKDEDGNIRKRREQDKTKTIGYNIVSGKLSFEFSKIIDINGVTPTLVAIDASKLGVIDGKGIRTLTTREGLRLFGYPEDYSLDVLGNSKKGKAEAFDLLGNTVVIPAMKSVIRKVALAYDKQKEV
ncbi:MAG: DNA (cytosine-5-)-methyltransferase [Bacilli bacterium]